MLLIIYSAKPMFCHFLQCYHCLLVHLLLFFGPYSNFWVVTQWRTLFHWPPPLLKLHKLIDLKKVYFHFHWCNCIFKEKTVHTLLLTFSAPFMCIIYCIYLFFHHCESQEQITISQVISGVYQILLKRIK